MKPDLVEVTLSGEPLRSVRMLADEDVPDMISAIVLTFGAVDLILIADPDEDSLVWGSPDDLRNFTVELDGSVWQRFIGKVPWHFWEMTNQTGNPDAFQVQFFSPGDTEAIVQLLVEASEIDIYVLERVTNLTR